MAVAPAEAYAKSSIGNASTIQTESAAAATVSTNSTAAAEPTGWATKSTKLVAGATDCDWATSYSDYNQSAAYRCFNPSNQHLARSTATANQSVKRLQPSSATLANTYHS